MTELLARRVDDRARPLFQAYDEAPTTAVFNITGIEDAVAGVREICGW